MAADGKASDDGFGFPLGTSLARYSVAESCVGNICYSLLRELVACGVFQEHAANVVYWGLDEDTREHTESDVARTTTVTGSLPLDKEDQRFFATMPPILSCFPIDFDRHRAPPGLCIRARARLSESCTAIKEWLGKEFASSACEVLLSVQVSRRPPSKAPMVDLVVRAAPRRVSTNKALVIVQGRAYMGPVTEHDVMLTHLPQFQADPGHEK